jgi:hypothetical protein
VDFGAKVPRAGRNAHFFEWGASYLAAKSLVKADLVNQVLPIPRISAQKEVAMIVLYPLDGWYSIILVSS